MPDHKITQGCYSFLPELSDKEILLQLQFALKNNWLIAIEYTDEIHIRNGQWVQWGLPLFDFNNAERILIEINRCRYERWREYIKIVASNYHI